MKTYKALRSTENDSSPFVLGNLFDTLWQNFDTLWQKEKFLVNPYTILRPSQIQSNVRRQLKCSY